MRWLTYIILVVHFLWFVLIIAGFIGLIFIPDELYLRIYLAVISITLITNVLFRGCPLTKLEDRFQLSLNGEMKYNNGKNHSKKCITYYTRRFFGIELADIYSSITLVVFFIITLFLFFIR